MLIWHSSIVRWCCPQHCAGPHQGERPLDIASIGDHERKIAVRAHERIEGRVAGQRDRLLAVASGFLQSRDTPGAARRPGQQHRQAPMPDAASGVDDLGRPTRRFLAESKTRHVADIRGDPGRNIMS